MTEQEKYIFDLRCAKQWLENHCADLEKEIAGHDNSLKELKEGKEWLEKHSEEQEKYIAELLREREGLYLRIETFEKTDMAQLLAENEEMKKRLSTYDEEQKKRFDVLIQKIENLEKARDYLVEQLMKTDKYHDLSGDKRFS